MIPWDYVTFLAEGHTVEFKTSISEKFKYAILTNKLKILPQMKFSGYADSNVTFLWIVPVSERELEVMKESGSQPVLNKLDKLGEEIFNLERKEVV